MSPYSLCRGEYSNAFLPVIHEPGWAGFRDLRIVGYDFVSFSLLLPLFLFTTSTSKTFLPSFLPSFLPPLLLLFLFPAHGYFHRGHCSFRGMKRWLKVKKISKKTREKKNRFLSLFFLKFSLVVELLRCRIYLD